MLRHTSDHSAVCSRKTQRGKHSEELRETRVSSERGAQREVLAAHNCIHERWQLYSGRGRADDTRESEASWENGADRFFITYLKG